MAAMISHNELRQIAEARLSDCEILYRNQRYDAAVYLCGYAIELALKGRICQTLKWEGFPTDGSEFKSYQSFKTHNLVALLHLSGLEPEISTQYLTEWSDVSEWDPESRYKSIGTA